MNPEWMFGFNEKNASEKKGKGRGESITWRIFKNNLVSMQEEHELYMI